MIDILQKVNGPYPSGNVHENKKNQVSLVTEFTDLYDRDVATIAVRGTQLTMGEGHPFLPIG